MIPFVNLVDLTATVVWATPSTTEFVSIEICLQTKFSRCLAITSGCTTIVDVYSTDASPVWALSSLRVLNVKVLASAHLGAGVGVAAVTVYGVHKSLWSYWHVGST